MTINKKLIVQAFDKAIYYDRHARIQHITAQILAKKIKEYYLDKDQPNKILEIGCGTGFLTKQLITLFPQAELIVSDISKEMLLRTQEKIGFYSNVSYQVIDGENITLYDQFDLICSNFVFQWFNDLFSSIQNCTNLLNPNGCLMLTTLASNTFNEWKSIFADLKLMHPFHPFPQFEDLKQAVFEDCAYQWSKNIVIDPVSSGLKFFQELKYIGADTRLFNENRLKTSALLKTIKKFDQELNYSSYEVAYGIFHKYSHKGFFITGTDTNIGKTFISACLVKALNASYWKPLQTGLAIDQRDSQSVQQLTKCNLNQIIPSYIELAAPLSPEEAAKAEHQSIYFDDIEKVKYCTNKPLIVEGAGGILVPITSDHYMIDLMKRINLPIILVTRTLLGTINHTLMSIKILRDHGLTIAGIIMNGEPNHDNRTAIERHGKVKILAEIPYLSEISDELLEEYGQLIIKALKVTKNKGYQQLKLNKN